MNIISEKLINFRVYDANQEILALADVELPTLEAMSETVSGAGIAGELESPTLGHYGSMKLKLKWRVIHGDLTSLATPVAHALELRGSIQRYNAALGIYDTEAVKIVARAIPKTVNLGTFTPAKPTDSESEFEVSYLKVFVGGLPRVEIDKLNFICIINGFDYLAMVRMDLGGL